MNYKLLKSLYLLFDIKFNVLILKRLNCRSILYYYYYYIVYQIEDKKKYRKAGPIRPVSSVG